MNPKIQELAEQAWDETAVSPEFGHPTSFAQRFSDLVITECAEVAVEKAEYCELKMMPYQCLYDYIRSHFEVKE